MKSLASQIKNKLSPREMEIVALICAGETRESISRSLSISVHTYDGHRKNIRQKLDIRTQADWIRILHLVSTQKH